MSALRGLVATVCAIAVTCAGTLLLRAQTQPTTVAERIALFSRYVEPFRVQAGIPGLSAAAVVGGRIVWEQGYGFADFEAHVAAAPDTPYRIASLTKTFTSVLLMQCVEASTLSLDTPIRTYTSTVPDPVATIRHVVSMTSDAPPGTRYRYDGDRFAALTPVVQACMGEPYRAALASRILNRLGMIDSVPGQDLEGAPPDVTLFDASTLDRHLRSNLRRQAPHGSCERCRIADGSRHDIERVAVVTVLRVRHVAVRHRFEGRIALAHVADNTDDRHLILAIEETENRSADRVLAGERLPNERFIDDDHRGAVSGIALVKVAAALQGNSQRGKRAGRHDSEERPRLDRAVLLFGTRSTKYDPSPLLVRSPGGIDVAPTAMTPGSAAIREETSLKNTSFSGLERIPVAFMTSTFSG